VCAAGCCTRCDAVEMMRPYGRAKAKKNTTRNAPTRLLVFCVRCCIRSRMCLLGGGPHVQFFEISLRVFEAILCRLVNPNHVHLCTYSRRDLVNGFVFEEKSAKTWLQRTLC